MAQQPILEIRNLVKHYPKVQAVNGVSFAIREGICFGLLGPNGAGKTTTIEMIEGIKPATSGEILFRGTPAGAHFREKAGIQFQETAIQDYLTVRETLDLFGALYEDKADVAELIRLCALDEFLDRETDKISGGQKQRMLLAVALVNNPDIVFLDEPTTGLDPQARRNFWDLVQKIKKRNKTVVLTTHYMEEAYVLCDEIAIMDRGQIIAHGAPDTLLKEHFDGMMVELPLEDFKPVEQGFPWKSFEHNGWVEIRTQQVSETLQHLISKGANLAKLKVRSQTLEDLFLELTGKALREG
jgi:ABC-2 type transport system ATP-binding protein